MNQLMWLLKWILKAAIFFTLFSFALNNQHEVTVHFFFGTHWQTSLVLVVLSAFAVGLGIGALGMVPRWLKQRRAAQRALRAKSETLKSDSAASTPLHGL
jgi:uncharacterized integral membrane protein